MTHEIFLEGGCFAIFGCSSHTDEWLEDKHTEILQELSSVFYHSVSTKTRRLPNGDILLSYKVSTTEKLSVIKEKINTILPCDEKEYLYIKRKNPETKEEKIMPPNYPHLVISYEPIQKVNLISMFQYSELPNRRWSLS